jgi:tetratricopeptide (TPR) repeat protein
MNDDFQSGDTLETTSEKPTKPKRRLGRLILLGIAGILLIDTLSGFAGYQVGLIQRRRQEIGMRVYKAAQQFERGVVDLRSGNYIQAKQRFIFVAELDPNYPGIVDMLAQVDLAMLATATPTVGPTQAVVIPSNLKGSEALLNQAREYLSQKQWAAVIEVLDRLRQEDIQYNTVDVDGLYFMALRNLGVDNMLKNGKLEQGMYNLAIAEKYGPIDKDAEGYRTWVGMYKTAASYWEIDWDKMVYWMEQVYNMLPGIRDGSNYTSGERLRVGYIELGDAKMREQDYCAADTLYGKALAIRSDGDLQGTHTKAHDKCIASIATPVIISTPIETPIIQDSTPIVPEGTPIAPQ